MAAPRRVVANVVLTLDGRATGPGGPGDMSCIAPHGVTAQARAALLDMTTATTVLLGRKNYEGFHSYWPHVATDATADPHDRAFARWLDAVDKIVFTGAPGALGWSNSRPVNDSPAEVVRRLRTAHDSGDIRVLSSLSVIRQLLAAGELDALELTLAPYIAGQGQPLFDQDVLPSSDWQLVQPPVPTDSGAVRLTYLHVR